MIRAEIKRNAEFLGKEGMTIQTMEESAELAKACSKMLRANGIGQTTPITKEEAKKNLSYAIADMHICLLELAYLYGIDDVDVNVDIAVKAFRERNGLPSM